MSDQFPSLAAVVAAHRWVSKSTFSRYRAGCSCGWERDIVGTNRKGLQLHGEHVEQVWREACTVKTREALDALPVGTVLREDYDGTIWTLHDGGKHIEAYRECDYLPLLTSAITLPARVIHHPDWETK